MASRSLWHRGVVPIGDWIWVCTEEPAAAGSEYFGQCRFYPPSNILAMASNLVASLLLVAILVVRPGAPSSVRSLLLVLLAMASNQKKEITLDSELCASEL